MAIQISSSRRPSVGAALRLFALSLVSVCLYGRPGEASAADACEALARLMAIQGKVELRHAGGTREAGQIGKDLCAGDEIYVGASAKAALSLRDQAMLPLAQNTRLVVLLDKDGSTLLLNVKEGKVSLAAHRDQPIRVVTPHGDADMRSGDLSVSVAPGQTRFGVISGNAQLADADSTLSLKENESAYFDSVSRPARDVTLQPVESVRWVLHYPTIVQPASAGSPELKEAAQAYRDGRLLDALIRLEQSPETAQSMPAQMLRANLLLNAGRVDEAESAIADAVKTDPKSPEAWSLKALTTLSRNDAKAALVAADRAVEADPRSTAAHLARSYALQANLRLDDALAEAREVVAIDATYAYGHARVAELELILGRRAAALEAAERAESLDPKLSYAKSIKGMSLLALQRVPEAKQSFEQAVTLDSCDPRARLGLGLAKIRSGDLHSGRAELELAASLDPANALVHTYLGRAYAEEGRSADAAQQYARARADDQRDPTPYVFESLRLANANQPVSALEEQSEALTLNQTRAVVRSEALLQEDEALRRANISALQRELGFEDEARRTASEAVADAPQSWAGHDALSNSLNELPRAERARRSESWQSVLRAPSNAPFERIESVGESSTTGTTGVRQRNVLQVADPGATGFDDYAAVFDQPLARLRVEAIQAGNNTRADSLQVRVSPGPLGVELGSLRVRSDGDTEDAAFKTEVLQGRVWVDPFQGSRFVVEGRRIDSVRNELTSPNDPGNIVKDAIDEDGSVIRGAFVQKLGEKIEVIGAVTHETKHQIDYSKFVFSDDRFGSLLDTRILSPEGQITYSGATVRLIAGSGKTRYSVEQAPIPGGCVGPCNVIQRKFEYHYLYSRVSLPAGFSAEVGGSMERLTREGEPQEWIRSPKLGLTWKPSPGTTLRAASYGQMNRPFAGGETLEPTQVAGFAQFYPDELVSRYRRQGVGIDQAISASLTSGAEWSRRKLLVTNAFLTEDLRREREIRLWLDWRVPRAYSPSGWEMSANLAYDRLRLSREGFSADDSLTFFKANHLTLTGKAFHSSGLGFELAVTRASDKGNADISLFNPADFSFTPVSREINDSAWFVDTALNYRFAQRRGQLTVGFKNLFNERGFDYVEIDPANPRYSIGRFMYGRIVFTY